MGGRNVAVGQTRGPARIGICVPEHEGPGYVPPNSVGAMPSSFPGVSEPPAKVTESETVLVCDPPLISYASSPRSSRVCIQKIRPRIRQTPAPQTVFCGSLVQRSDKLGKHCTQHSRRFTVHTGMSCRNYIRKLWET